MNKKLLLYLYIFFILLLVGCGTSAPEESIAESGLTNAGGIASLGTDQPLPTALPPTPTLRPLQATSEPTLEPESEPEPEPTVEPMLTQAATAETATEQPIQATTAASATPKTIDSVAPTIAPTTATTNVATTVASVATATRAATTAATDTRSESTEQPLLTPPPPPTKTPLPTANAEVLSAEPEVTRFELAQPFTRPSDPVKLLWQVKGVSSVKIERFGGEWGEADAEWIEGNEGEIVQSLPLSVSGWPIFYKLTSPDSTELLNEFTIEAPCEFDWLIEQGSNGPCPEEGVSSRGAHQNFENGFMVWIEDQDTIIYSTYDGLVHQELNDTFGDGDPIRNETITAPAGYYQPEYGFGKVWRETPGARGLLGWAIDVGANYTVKRQSMAASRYGYTEWITLRDGGLITISNPDPLWQIDYNRPASPAGPAVVPTATIPPLPTITPQAQATSQVQATAEPAARSTVNYFRTNMTRAERGSTVLLDWDVSGVSEMELHIGWMDNALGGSEIIKVPASQTGYELVIGDNWHSQVIVLLMGDSAETTASVEIAISCPYRWFYESTGEVCSTEPIISSGSMQQFQGGYMIWVEQINTIYAFTTNGGIGWRVSDTFDVNVDPIQDDTLTTPSAGLLQPTYGFGKVWRGNNTIKEILGWGISHPQNYQVVVQCTDFARYNTCYVRMRDGHVLEVPGTGSPEWTVHTDWNGFKNPKNGYK